jgi:DNA-binding transcriptional LysR family regulator
MAITLNGLRFFVAVAEAGSIVDAASRLARGPSTVSMALKQLEAELGGALFESDRKNRLTPLGRFTLAAARNGVHRFDQAVDDIRDYARGQMGRLSVASVPSVAAHLLPDVIDRFIGAHPSVDLDLRDTDSDAIETAVIDGSIDLGIAGRPTNSGSILFEPLFEDRFVLICSCACPLAERRGVSRADLGGHVLIANGASARLRTELYATRAAGTNLTVRNMASLLALVRRNVGVTILPSLSIPGDDAGLVRLEIVDEKLYRLVGTLRRKGENLAPAAAAFLGLLQGHVADQIVSGAPIQAPTTAAGLD